ncbi:MAG TPA: cysteine desulfurase-like protein [Beutenbergiaceae bacterium]|nr:cysteine desulfurase-like protein [Beutenbergiaceae bacterium]
MTRSYSLEQFRSHFPALEHAAFFDNAGGTQTPLPVARAIAGALTGGLSQRGPTYAAARNSDEIVLSARAAMGDFLNVDPTGVVFGRSATQLIFDFADPLAAGLGAGDEIAVSRLDHDANVRPWVLAAEKAGASLRWIDFDPATGDLTTADVERVLSPRTKLVALTAASNLYGSKPNIPEIAKRVHEVGAIFFVDAVAYAPYELVDFPALGADYLVCSPYKFFGPHLGVLAARPAALERLAPRKLLPSPDSVPERFEQGTLPYELLAGVSATADFLAGFSSARSRRERLEDFYAAAGAHEEALAGKIVAGLEQIPGARRIGAPAHPTPTVLFTVEGRTVSEVASFLGERDIAVSAGTFYAHEAAARAHLGDGGIRVSLAPYTSAADVEALLAAVREIATR